MSEIVKVAVFGARGRMGAEVCRAVEAADGLQLVAGVDVGDDRTPVEAADVVVDFTHPDAVMDNLAWCIEHGVHAVVGTTGFTDERLDSLRSQLRGHDVGVLVAANFSIGAVLDDALRRPGGRVLRERGDHRAASPEQGRRAIRHGGDHGAPDRRGPAGRRAAFTPGRDGPGAALGPVGPTWTASGCTAYGCAA